MSLLNSKINGIEAEVESVAASLATLQATIAAQGTNLQTSSVPATNAVVSVIGDDANDATGFRLLDALGNLRGISGSDPYQFVLNNKTLTLSGPPRISSNGDNATNGQNLMLNNVIKSLKGGGYVQLTQDPGSITIGTTSNLDAILSTIPSLMGYLNSATNDAGDTSTPKLIVLGTNNSSLTIDYSQLRTMVFSQ